jgi:biopolymer transport protein TolR
MRPPALAPLSQINVTSLVDVSLTILIVFMITAPLMKLGMDVELPQTSAAQPRDEEGVTITLTDDGKIAIGERVVTMENFEKALRQALAGYPGRPVYLKADKNVRYGVVAEVIGTIKEAGVVDLGLLAEPPLRRQ